MSGQKGFAPVREILDSIQDGLVVFNEESRVIAVNPAAEHLLGLEESELLGRSYQEVLPAAVGGPQDAGSTEHYFEAPGKWCEIRVSPTRGGGLTAQLHDITKCKRAGEAVRQSEERFQALAEALPDIVWTADADGRVDWFNQRWHQYTGTPEGFGTGWSWDQVCHPDDVAHTLARWKQAREQAAIFRDEIRIRRHDGRFRWFLSRAWPLRDAEGNIFRWFGTSTDVQDLKEAEEALNQSRMDLNHAQEVGQIGSWRLDVRRNILSWSDENHRIFGVPVGTPLTYETFLSIVHPDDREYVDRKWNAGLRGEPYDIEHRILTGGQVKWVRERAYLEFDADGVLTGGFGITQDITARKLIEEERERQAQLKDEFLALLGHELRNPLAAISTAVHLVASGVTAERRASLEEMIARQVKVLQRLVDDLLDLARITHGQIELTRDPLDLSAFLQKATAAAQSLFAGRAQELIVRLPVEPVRFVADGVRLEQIVTNLLDNASKYTGQGGRIEVSGAREGSSVVLRCKDNGRGIPPEMQGVIFEPFARALAAKDPTEGGVGIGLALVKHLAELHGGTVSVHSDGPGAGSEFTVTLALVEPPTEPPAVAAAAPARRAARALSLVVVEDNPDVARSMVFELERAGHKVTLFGDGPSALAGLTRRRPHAILLDIGLPGMDGYELAARLRRMRNLARAQLVAISGFKRRPLAADAHDDFDHYLVKPVNSDELLALLEKHAEREPRPVLREPKPLRVLLVEDNAELAEATAGMLRGEGLEVKVALSGAEALEAAGEFRPQLTLCDMRLPDLPGLKVVEALRSSAATRRTRAVVLTAMSEPELRLLSRRARALRVDLFVSKPLTPDKLRTVLDRFYPRHC